MQNVENNDVVEIDLMEIFGLMLHRLWLIILCAVAVAAAGYAVSRFVIELDSDRTVPVNDKDICAEQTEQRYTDLQ